MRAHARLVGVYRAVAFVSIGLEMLGGCAASRFLFGSAAPQPCLATLSAVDQQAAGLAGCPSDLSVPIVIFSRQSRARWFQPPPLTRRRRVLEGHEARA